MSEEQTTWKKMSKMHKHTHTHTHMHARTQARTQARTELSQDVLRQRKTSVMQLQKRSRTFSFFSKITLNQSLLEEKMPISLKADLWTDFWWSLMLVYQAHPGSRVEQDAGFQCL